MNNIPTDLRYAQSHEWVRAQGDTATVGLTDHAQRELAAVVSVQLPSLHRQVRAGEPCAVVHAAQTLRDIRAPVSGEVVAVNPAVAGQPELVNTDPYGHGWLFRLRLTEPDELKALLTAADYRAQITRRPGVFPPTPWTLVLQASRGNEAQARQAVDELCVLYSEPIRAWLRHGPHRERAEDLRQDFIVYLLEKNPFQNFKRGQAKFRSFLLVCLKRFVKDKGKPPLVPMDVEPVVIVEYDKHFDRPLAVALARSALHRLADERYPPGPKRARFEELRRFIFGDDRTVPYEEIGRRLDMTCGAVRKAVHDLRAAFYDYFRAEVREKVTDEDVDGETRYLMTLLAEVDPAELE